MYRPTAAAARWLRAVGMEEARCHPAAGLSRFRTKWSFVSAVRDWFMPPKKCSSPPTMAAAPAPRATGRSGPRDHWLVAVLYFQTWVVPGPGWLPTYAP